MHSRPALILSLIYVSAWSLGCTTGTKLPIGIITEEAAFDNDIFLFEGHMNLIHEIRLGEFNPSPGREILIVCDDGYRILTTRGKLLRQVGFSYNKRWNAHSIWGGRALDLDQDGRLEFVGVLNPQGRTVVFDWEGKPIRDVYSTTYADLVVLNATGDQRDKFLINQWQRLAVYGANPSEDKTVYKGVAMNVQPLGNNAKGQPLIGFDTPEAPWHIVIIDGRGAQIHRWAVPWDSFTFSPMPNADGQASRMVFSDGDHLVVTDLAGKPLRRYKAPFARMFAHFHAATVNGPDGGGYLLVVANGTGENHVHMVYLFHPDGELIFQWRGWDNGGPLLILEAPQRNYPTFLVGGRNEIRRFSPRPNMPPSHPTSDLSPTQQAEAGRLATSVRHDTPKPSSQVETPGRD